VGRFPGVALALRGEPRADFRSAISAFEFGFAWLAWFAVKIPRRVSGFVLIRGIRVKYLCFIRAHLWLEMDFRPGLPHRLGPYATLSPPR
jgi:hypothetical protein